MRDDRSGGKNIKKAIIVGALAIGASTMLFQGFTQVAAAAELGKTKVVPTSYVNYANKSSQTSQNNIPEGYKKANYTIKGIDLPYYQNSKPTSKDMIKEAAVEIGAQALWQVFGLSLEGQVIQMGYNQATENMPRSHWFGYIQINGEKSNVYSFEVDSVTGELFSIVHGRTLKENVSVAFDSALDKNPQEYLTLAKKMAEKYNAVHGAVKSVKYIGQGYGNSEGYGNSDPSTSIEITGENGEIALMGFSRYDKALLSIGYNASYKYTLEQIEKIEQEMQAKEAARKALPSSVGENATFTLVAD